MRKPKLYVREPDDAAQGRGAALTGGALVLALLAGLGWLAAGRADPPPALAQVSTTASPARPASGVAAAASVPAMTMVPVVLPALSATTLPPGQIEVCAVGVVSEAEWNGRARREAFGGSVRKAFQSTVTALKASSDPLRKGLGLAMESSYMDDMPVDADAVCDHAGCPAKPTKDELTAAYQKRLAANSAPRDALARLALTSRSPEVYGLAWRVCSTDGAKDTTSACRMLSVAQWARLDPDNAMAWAGVLAQARAANNREAAADALYRMSLASVVDSRAGRLPGLVLAQVPAGTPALETEAVVADVALRAAVDPALELLQNTTAECTAAAVRDSNRWQRCDALAQTLWKHGRRTLDLLTAVQIGKALDWPAERLQPMRDEASALAQVTAETTLEPSLSCAAVRRRISYYDGAGGLGEVAWARRAIADSGKPLAHWAAAAEAQRKAARAEAAASAVPAIP